MNLADTKISRESSSALRPIGFKIIVSLNSDYFRKFLKLDELARKIINLKKINSATENKKLHILKPLFEFDPQVHRNLEKFLKKRNGKAFKMITRYVASIKS